jgi:hypothetical protein
MSARIHWLERRWIPDPRERARHHEIVSQRLELNAAEVTASTKS